MLFSLGDHDLPRIFISDRFQCFCHSSYLSHFVSPSNIFSRCFLVLRFLSIIPLVTGCSRFSLLITWPKKVVWRFCFLFMSDLVSASSNTDSFDFFAVPKIHSILQRNHFSVASFLLYLSSRPRIHTSEWVQYNSPGLFFLCKSRCGYLLALISFSENSFLLAQFQCCCAQH